MKQSRNFTLFLHSLESFFTTWALMKAARLEPGNIFTAVFFLLAFFLYRRIHYRLDLVPFSTKAPIRQTALITSALFTILYMLVDSHKYIEELTNPMFRLIVLTSVFIGFLLLFYKLLLFLYSYTGNKAVLSQYLFLEAELPVKSGLVSLFYQHSGLCAALLCLVGWFPYFLYEYPGIMTPDSINQTEQLLHLIPYSNHHPVAHTLTIRLFYQIGSLFSDSPIVAISFYTVFQMIFMACSISYLINTLKAYRVKPLFLFLITLFYALVPYHAVYSVTIWKDILFSGAVLFLVCAMLRLSLRLTKGALLCFLFSGIMICLFRSNGWYGFLLCLPFFLFFYRKKARIFYPLLFVIVLTAGIIKYPVMNHAGVLQPDFIESCSIPTQQIAAVICNDRPLTKEQLSLITKVVDLTYIKDLYNPTYADNMKELVRAGNQAYLTTHKKEFFKLWLTLLFQYPGDYLHAYVQQTYGYWYPDNFYLVAEADGVSGSSLGISHTPLIRGPLVIKGKEVALKLGNMLPLYSLLFSMGVIFWVMLFCMSNAIVRQEKEKLIFYLPSFCLYLTVLIATPVATEFRYVYFMVFSLPLYLMLMVLEKPENNSVL